MEIPPLARMEDQFMRYVEGTPAAHTWETLRYVMNHKPEDKNEEYINSIAEVCLTHIMFKQVRSEHSQETLADKL